MFVIVGRSPPLACHSIRPIHLLCTAFASCILTLESFWGQGSRDEVGGALCVRVCEIEILVVSQ